MLTSLRRIARGCLTKVADGHPAGYMELYVNRSDSTSNAKEHALRVDPVESCSPRDIFQQQTITCVGVPGSAIRDFAARRLAHACLYVLYAYVSHPNLIRQRHGVRQERGDADPRWVNELDSGSGNRVGPS